MLSITHEEKVLWQVRLNYHSIPSENIIICSPWIENHYFESTRRSKEQWNYLHRAYYYCTQIDCVYEGSFEDFVKSQNTSNPYGRRYRKGYGKYWWYGSEYKKSSYQKKPHHEKKILSEKEIAKRDWREKKQFRRDKANRHSNRGPQKFFTKIANRTHRRRIKQNIHHGRWDMSDREYKHFCDPWDWS